MSAKVKLLQPTLSLLFLVFMLHLSYRSIAISSSLTLANLLLRSLSAVKRSLLTVASKNFSRHLRCRLRVYVVFITHKRRYFFFIDASKFTSYTAHSLPYQPFATGHFYAVAKEYSTCDVRTHHIVEYRELFKDSRPIRFQQ